MEIFSVTYVADGVEHTRSMNGNELAKLYGFSDCTGVDILEVHEIVNGRKIRCEIWGSCYAPYNVIYVHRFGNYEPYEYEWPEH